MIKVDSGAQGFINSLKNHGDRELFVVLVSGVIDVRSEPMIVVRDTDTQKVIDSIGGDVLRNALALRAFEAVSDMLSNGHYPALYTTSKSGNSVCLYPWLRLVSPLWPQKVLGAAQYGHMPLEVEEQILSDSIDALLQFSSDKGARINILVPEFMDIGLIAVKMLPDSFRAFTTNKL